MRQGLGGVWLLDRYRGDLPGAASEADAAVRGGRRGGGGGRMGGGGGRGMALDPKAQEEERARRQAMADYVRASTAVSKQLTIVVNDTSVSITDADGRVQILSTDNKKIDGRAANGLIKISTKNRWDGTTLVCETNVDFGPRITRSYALSPGGTELRLTTTVDEMGQPLSLIRFYGRPVEDAK